MQEDLRSRIDKNIAKIKNIPLAQVEEETTKKAMKFFGIK